MKLICVFSVETFHKTSLPLPRPLGTPSSRRIIWQKYILTIRKLFVSLQINNF